MKCLKLSHRVCGLVSMTLMLAGTHAAAAPIDDRANSCTFVDAVVNGPNVISAQNSSETWAGSSAAAVMDAADQAGAPSALDHCDIVHFDTPIADASGASNSGAIRQKYQFMSIIFEGQDVTYDEPESLFVFRRPAADKSIYDIPN